MIVVSCVHCSIISQRCPRKWHIVHGNVLDNAESPIIAFINANLHNL